VRALAYERPTREGSAGARLTRINRLFMLDDRYVPGPSILSWQGNAVLEPAATPHEIPVK
jgi:hypothetical protein